MIFALLGCLGQIVIGLGAALAGIIWRNQKKKHGVQ